MIGVRWREEGWEGQCEKCRQWWPIDQECWTPKQGVRQCRACHNEVRSGYLRRLRNEQPELRARHRASSRANQAEKRRVNRDAYLEYQRRWYVKNAVRSMAERAERYAIEAELAGRKVGRSTRTETPETRAYRAAYRAKWIEDNGPVVVSTTKTMTAAERRAYKREWMRAYRAEKAA